MPQPRALPSERSSQRWHVGLDAPVADIQQVASLPSVPAPSSPHAFPSSCSRAGLGSHPRGSSPRRPSEKAMRVPRRPDPIHWPRCVAASLRRPLDASARRYASRTRAPDADRKASSATPRPGPPVARAGTASRSIARTLAPDGDRPRRRARQRNRSPPQQPDAAIRPDRLWNPQERVLPCGGQDTRTRSRSSPRRAYLSA
jgi:hypothetical protein